MQEESTVFDTIATALEGEVVLPQPRVSREVFFNDQLTFSFSFPPSRQSFISIRLVSFMTLK